MSEEGNPILGAGVSTAPAGVGAGPTPIDRMLSKAPTWFQGDAYQAEYARLYQLKREAVDRLLIQYEKLQRAKAQAVSGSASGENRTPVGRAPALGGAPAKVVGYLHSDGTEPAAVLESAQPLAEAGGDETSLDQWGLAVRIAERHVLWAKQDLTEIEARLNELVSTLGNELTRTEVDRAALSQMLGHDREADERLDNARQVQAERLGHLAATHRRREGPLSDEATTELLNGIANAQLLLDDDHPVVAELLDVLRRRAEFSDVSFFVEPPPVPPDLSRVYVVRPIPDQNGFRAHEVRKGENLYVIARKHYGNPNEWPRIFEANRDIIKNAHLIQPGWKLKIPPLKK